MCKVSRAASRRQEAALRKRTNRVSRDRSRVNRFSKDRPRVNPPCNGEPVGAAPAEETPTDPESEADDDAPVQDGPVIPPAAPDPHDPWLTSIYGCEIDPTNGGQVYREMKKGVRGNISMVKRTMKYLRNNGRLHLDVDLDELRARPDGPKNIKLAEEAELKMASLDFPLITTTTLALDRKKRPIAAYFSHHFSDNGIIIYDNARKRRVLNKHEDTQWLYHKHHKPIKAKCTDARHQTDAQRQYMTYIDENGDEQVESKGLRHDNQYWAERGHPDRVGPSAALLGKSREEKYSIVGLTHSDGLIQDHLSRLLKGVWPGEFKQLKKAFDRGNWACDNGAFTGGEAVLPDLGLKFRYAPGDILIFFSDALYHSILPWTPSVKAKDDFLSPGRVSWVFNTHRDILKKFLGDDWEKWVYDGTRRRTGYK
ncbi:hypothetical protein NLI96_g11237 [Meripilus lineatus]|uniref:Uncharacterized protein n=1 Tax=Meripilus lineatus TaxID=2056292 RepID=A0AAD5UUJ5_9APHY|nr:hypothetical protein NLI96_g11237 [Physisporinus lineatus]